jgi:hypothetical protein
VNCLVNWALNNDYKSIDCDFLKNRIDIVESKYESGKRKPKSPSENGHSILPSVWGDGPRLMNIEGNSLQFSKQNARKAKH